MTTTCGIYEIRHTPSGVRYIGSSRTIEKRWRSHGYALRKGTHPNGRLQASWNKHGADQFAFVIVAVVGQDDLLRVETEMIRDAIGPMCFNAKDQAVRSAWGRRHRPATIRAMKGRVRSPEENANRVAALRTPEVRAKISKGVKGRAWTPTQRERLLETMRSDEYIAKQQKAQTGRRHTEETKRKIGLGTLGRVVPEEQKARQRAAMTGRTASPETRAKMAASQRARRAA